jgi:hypothetical protein
MHSTNPLNVLDLPQWANFYLVTSAAAATLIGLLFVVITLAAERGVDDLVKIRMYLTPTVVFFGSVLIIAALLTFPNHTRLTATLCISLAGVGGLVYSGTNLIRGVKERHDLINYALVRPIEGRLRREQGVGPQLGCRHTLYETAAPEAMSQAQLDFFWSEQGAPAHSRR